LPPIREQYSRRKTKYDQIVQQKKHLSNRISNLRLAVFLTGAAVAVFAYQAGFPGLAFAVVALFTALFIFLVYQHTQTVDSIKYYTALVNLNANAIKRLQGNWKSFADTGAEFMDADHPYAQDLDLFGQNSLFQYINSTTTYQGRQKLRQVLTAKPANVKLIRERQIAVAELAQKLSWRQRFAAAGLMHEQPPQQTEQLSTWAKQRNKVMLQPGIVLALRLLPLLTMVTALLTFRLHVIPPHIPVLLLVSQFLLLKIKKRARLHLFNMAEKYRDDLKRYSKMLRLIEKQPFKAAYLVRLKQKLYNREQQGASRQIEQLSRIVDSIANRRNMFYFIFNLLILWEYQSLIALEAWKEKSGAAIPEWFDVIGEFECLASLAILKHDHPAWVMPRVTDGAPGLSAKQLGHPLLGDNRVCNDLTVQAPFTVLLITGSNMSGKSTLLRTAGINLVLAYAGAPVCAREFCCTRMDLYTCMRVRDDLEQNISSFYAELLRIKQIVQAVAAGKKVFFLLDEIFKGTNSRDRHTGAKILIRKLSKAGSCGLVSTHDLELGSLANEPDSKVKNYHFAEYYLNNEIHFDYKLKPGISPTRNALYLMRLAGIEIDAEPE